MNKVKVLFFADMLIADLDGASRTIFQLINRIPSEQFEYLFVCGTGPDKIADFECIHVISFKVLGNKTYRIASPLFQKFELDARIDNFSPDVIHITTPSPLGMFALKTAKRINVPVISIYHTHFVSYVDYYIKDFPLLLDFTKEKVKNSMRSFYNQCNLVYVPSNTMIDELTGIGIDREVFKLWQRGIDQQMFSPSKKNDELLKKFTGNNYPCILFTSRLVWEKNLQTLIDLYHLIEAGNLNYNLVVVGDGVAKEELQKQMPKAYFLGRLIHSRLAGVYASSQVFFFPSITETFGNVVLEAMASGLPCVVADGGGSRDFIEQGQNGFICDPVDAHDFLNKIEQIINQPELSEQFSDLGLQTSKKYMWETLAGEYFKDLKALAVRTTVS
ncbi:MAG: glycosyltransferase family 1 protein [Paludibacter sp.]|nr:glycosyltransferase family 1 protein [Paludibacter sp.]